MGRLFLNCSLLAVVLAATLSGAAPSFSSSIKCPITIDGRVAHNLTLETFDTTASPFNPYYSKGQNVSWSQILKFPNVSPSKFDIPADKAIEVTIDDRSIFVPGGGTPQIGFRRAGLLLGNGSDASNVGMETFHWSVRQDPKAKMNLTHEYMNAWHERNDYSANQFSFNTGVMLSQDAPTDSNVTTTGLNKKLWKFLNNHNDVIWTTWIEWDEWQNFAVTMDYVKESVPIFLSIKTLAYLTVSVVLSRYSIQLAISLSRPLPSRYPMTIVVGASSKLEF